MNKTFRVIWNQATGCFAAVQETAKGRSKSSLSNKVSRLLLGAAALVSGPAMALDLVVAPEWDAATNSHKVGESTFNTAGNHSLSGPANFQVITQGSLLNWADAIAQGYATAPDVAGAQQLVVGAKSASISIPDPITGNMKSVAVFDATSFAQGDLGTGFAGSNRINEVQVFPPDARPYVDLRLATVTNGELAVDLDSHIDLNAAKQTSLVKVDGTQGTQAEAVWKSANYVDFGASYQISATPDQTAARDQSFDKLSYSGTFSITDKSGVATSHTVTDLASLNQYNDWLVAQLKAGTIDYANYESAVKLAYTTTPVTVHVMPTGSDAPLPPGDPLFLAAGTRTMLEAVGPNATARIANPAGTTVELYEATALTASEGATVINDGRIGQTQDQAVAFDLKSGATGINNGVLTVGYASTAVDASPAGVVYVGGNNIVDGAGTRLTNKGIINVGAVNEDTRALAGFSQVEVRNQGEFVNEGAMNIGVNDSNLSSPVVGAHAYGGGKITNTASGVMYLGRGAGGDISGGSLAAGGADTRILAGGAAIIAQDSAQVDNQGLIVVGSGMHDSNAIEVRNATAAHVVNHGTIDVKGARAGSPLENRGILVQGDSGSSLIDNAGTIRLSGVNGIGVKTIGGAKAGSSGSIDVGTSTDPSLPNYGVWAEGANSAVTLGGAVNLAGDNTIGVHARDGGTIDIDGGSVNFGSGVHQLGFFAHGAGSTVNINSAPAGGALEVSTENSTLFRIEDGATINNTVSAPLVASGKGSTAITVTGVGSTADLDSMDISVTGQGATALKVEGGATGSMSGAAHLALSDGAIAVAVDDNKYDIAGNVVGRGDSKFTNTANVMTTGTNVTVFQVKNGAQMVNTGHIDVAHGTAIEITGAGSEVTGDAAGTAGTITVHDGKAGIYVHEGGTLTSADTITVDGGASGVLAGPDAGRVVLTQDAKVIGLGGGYGNLVTNQGAAGNMLIDGTLLEMAGSGAALLTENDLDAASHGTILVSSATGGKGLALMNIDGTRTDGDLLVGDNWRIGVTGNGSGVYANTTGDLAVANSQIQVSGSGTGVLVEAADQVTMEQGARLTGTSPDAVLVAGAPKRLVNHGVLQGLAGSDAVRLDDSGHAFENSDGGAITGNVVLGNGSNTALLADSSIDGNLAGGTGSDTVTLRGNGAQVSGALDGGRGAGIDTLVLDASTNQVIDPASRIANFENVALTNGSVLTLHSALKLDDNQADTGVLGIDASSTLAVAPGSAFGLNNKLAGDGLVTTDTGGQAFDFSGNVGQDFAGTVKLGDSRFTLAGVNTDTLENATLELGDKSVTTVGGGEQAIGSLKFSGGTASFDAEAPDSKVARSTITAGSLDASGTGTVRIHVPAPYSPAAPTDTTASLLEQDDGAIGVKLVNAASTTGSGGALALQDQNGQLVSARRNVDIAQAGVVVAKGEYDYGLSVQPDNGLYVNYGLQKLDLQQDQALALSARDGATGTAADLAAQVVGAGHLYIDAGNVPALSLSNTLNSYTGRTTVAAGTLRLAADNALGRTASLNLFDDAHAELGGYAQTIGQLQADSGSSLDMQSGKLTLLNGGRADGTLQGGGQLNIEGGKLTVTGDNTALTADTSIAGGAEVALKQAGGLGSGAIRDEGTLTLDGAQGKLMNGVGGAGALATTNGATVELAGNNAAFAGRFDVAQGTTLRATEAQHLGTAKVDNAGTFVVANNSDWTLANAVAGAGTLVKDGTGTLNIGDAVLHSGATTIDGGAVIVGDAANPSRSLGAAGAGEVSVGPLARLGGAGTVSGHVSNDGVVAALNALPGQAGAANSTLTLAHGLANRGTLDLRGPGGSTPGNVLHVKGDYAGSGGQLLIRTRMGGDDSPTDRLVVDGGKASGTTALVVKSAGGQGAQTTQGIRVVETRNGGSTDTGAFSLAAGSDGYRQGSGTLAVGAYDYGLVRGGTGGQAEDWYLSSGYNTPANPLPPLEPEQPAKTTAPTASPGLRPEVGAYLANRRAAMMMTAHTLHERQGQAPGVDGKDLAGSSDGNGWIRALGSVNSYEGAGSSVRNVHGGLHLIHGGADLLRFGDGGEGSIRIGAMGMHGSTRSEVRSNGLSARGTVDGYGLGVYGTWYGRRDILSGPYVDAWILGGSYGNKVQGQGLAQESYRVRGLTASLEAGYSFKVLEDGDNAMYIEPQAQVIVSNYRAADHTEATGTLVSGMKDSGVSTRLGLRFHGHKADDAGNKMMRPFAEFNWWHGESTQAMQFNADRVSEALPSNRFEAKVGLQGNLSSRISAWGAVSGEVGGQRYRAGKVQAGIKYSW